MGVISAPRDVARVLFCGKQSAVPSDLLVAASKGLDGHAADTRLEPVAPPPCLLAVDAYDGVR